MRPKPHEPRRLRLLLRALLRRSPALNPLLLPLLLLPNLLVPLPLVNEAGVVGNAVQLGGDVVLVGQHARTNPVRGSA